MYYYLNVHFQGQRVNPTDTLFYLTNAASHFLSSRLIYKTSTCNDQRAQEDGTDTAFRNVGSYTQDAREIPRRLLIAFGTRRKLENYNSTANLRAICFVT